MIAVREGLELGSELRACLQEAFGTDDWRVSAHQRLKTGVHRLWVEADGRASSVIAKRSDAAVARLSALVARRWLPAAGLAHLVSPLLGVAAEADGEATWHVYEDLPGRALATRPPVAGDVEAAIDAIAGVHTSFARHPLLPECRVAGGDRGIHFYSVNVSDAIIALDGLVVDRGAQDALLTRLHDLRDQEPERREALAAAGPDTLLHGDLWPSNVIVADGGGGGRVGVRLIDWDEAGVGPYGYDLSTLLLRFERPDRPAILDAYRRAAGRLAGWKLPPPRELGLILETAAQARLASLLVWSIAAAAEGEDWLVERLASIVEWLDEVTPVMP